jgi:hypothetical protein
LKEAAMESRPIPENTPRTLALALGAWSAGVALAAGDGVFARLAPAADVALVVFACAFALATYALDVQVRAHVHRMPASLLAAAAIAADVAIAFALRDGVEAGLASAVARLPLAMIAYFGLPLAAVAHVAALRAYVAPQLRSTAAKSPGASRAAT